MENGQIEAACELCGPDDGSPGAAKRAQVLDGARRVFLAKGFAAASMGEIARAAGVSKGTLYVYFESKTDLFHSLIEEMKRRTAEKLTAFDPANHDVEPVLTDFARRFIAELTDPAHVSLVRAVIGASEAFPEVGRSFFQHSGVYGARRLAAYLAAQMEDGVLAPDDPDDLAWRLIGMCNTPSLMSVVMGMPRPEPEEIERRARSVVRFFLAAARAGRRVQAKRSRSASSPIS